MNSTTGRRGSGEGLVRQRVDGRWEARIELGAAGNGRKQKSVYGKSKAEVLKKLRQAQQQRDQGLAPSPERLTLGAFLDQWLEVVVKPKVRPLSLVSYGNRVNLHLKPALGKVRLAKLTPQQVQAMVNQKLGEGLSPRTVREVRGVLRTALNTALKWGLVARNVAALTDAPRVEAYDVHPLDPDQARAFLDVAKGDRLEALYTVALALGLRQGEALGLRWQDVDLDGAALHLRVQLQRIEGSLQLRELKTKRSRRTMALPPFAVAALREPRKRQLEERLRVGEAWTDSGLIFTTRVGTPLSARNVVRSFHRMRAKAGLPEGFRFHDTRHTCASLLLAQGVHQRVVMDLLGHSQIGVTMDTYSHVMPVLRREAADQMEAVLSLGQ